MARSLVTATLAAALAFASAAFAQDGYPNRPIRLVVPQSAGSGSDVVARMLSEKLSQDLGQSVVVDNRGGPTASSAPRSSPSSLPTAIRCCWPACRS